MDDIRDIERALISYWKGAPDASDTFEGIAREWLPSTAPDKVATALEALRGRGLVLAVSRGSRLVYRLTAPPRTRAK